MDARDFWASSHYRLLATTPDGRLRLTDDFLRASLLRPELAPVPASSLSELALHEALVAHPQEAIAAGRLTDLGDEDVEHNYRVWLRFRDRLCASPTIEAAYMALFRDGVDVPPVFVQQLTQVVLRHILRDVDDGLEVRVAEMLFRPQKVAILEDGAVMAADADTIEAHAMTGSFGSLGELLQRNRVPTRTVDLEVLDEDNADDYWSRDERFDLAVSLNRGRAALAALCRVLERWIAHFLGVRVSIKPQREIDDKRWVWHVGLDAEASSLLNDIYNRVEIDEERSRRLLCLFELRFEDPADMRPAIAGRPVYLAMAIDARQILRLKPQNLLLNLPLATTQ